MSMDLRFISIPPVAPNPPGTPSRIEPFWPIITRQRIGEFFLWPLDRVWGQFERNRVWLSSDYPHDRCLEILRHSGSEKTVKWQAVASSEPFRRY